MAKGKRVVYTFISQESGRQCGYTQLKKDTFDKSRVYRRYDKNAQKVVDCKLKMVKHS